MSNYCAKSGSTKDFISTLNKRGFIVQQGKISHLDILKLCSEGAIDNCLGNNAGAPYAACFLPPAPNQEPSTCQQPPKGYDPDDVTNYPPNIDYLAPGFSYKLRPDEAIVLIGQTPPPASYFSFRSYLGFVENKPDNDYIEDIVAGNDYTGCYHLIFASLGDTLNNFFIATDNTPKGSCGNPFNSETVIISTADRSVNKQIRDALGVAGFSSSIMNNDNIPLELVNMGLEKGKDTFIFLMRAALWAQQNVGNDYMDNIDKYIKVFRITPKIPFANLNPWPIPSQRIRESGITEFQVVSNARNALDHLRNGIIKKYGGKDYDHIELDTTIPIPENYAAILKDVTTYGDTRDTSYFRTENFQLTTDEDFLILYGINHKETGKAVYSNASFYGDELFNGVAAAFSTVQFPNSADEYFPKCYNNSQYYYVYKMARKANEDNVVIIPYSTCNPLGKAYGVDNCQDAFIVFRVYVDQKALVGPALSDIIWDRAILFKKKRHCSSR